MTTWSDYVGPDPDLLRGEDGDNIMVSSRWNIFDQDSDR